MAIDFFKKKDVMNYIEKNNNDIVEDYGNFINNNESTIFSFDSNFNEDIGYNSEPIPSIEQINYSNDIVSENNQIVESNDIYSDIQTEEHNNFNDTEIQTGFDPIDDIQPELNNNYNSVQNINNYDYNPIIDNMENAENNIKNSEDINVAFSNMYKNNKQKENKITEKIQEQKEDDEYENNTPVIIESDYTDVDPGYKKCPKCGQKIREDYKQCFNCGNMF